MKLILAMLLVVSSSLSFAQKNDSYICEELDGSARISAGDLCYNECKPKKEFLIGKKKSGMERESCIKCLEAHPEVYKIKANDNKIACSVNADESVVHCDNGYSYKRDNSVISDVDRNLKKEIAEKEKIHKKTGQASEQ